jgi:hypothetical protein
MFDTDILYVSDLPDASLRVVGPNMFFNSCIRDTTERNTRTLLLVRVDTQLRMSKFTELPTCRR